MEQTVEQLCEAIERHRLLSSREVATLRDRWFKPDRQEVADATRFCSWLVSNRYLTEFVVRVLQSGKADQVELNQYRLRDRLTTGPMAGAYLATDPLDRNVAVEVLAASQAGDPASVQAFQEAARQAMQLNHANVGRILDFGQAAGLHYLVKEYYQGETLAEVLRRRGKLAYLPATRIFALALAGLQALQERNLPPGDLSPESLVLTPIVKAGARQHTIKILHAGVQRRLFDSSAIGQIDPESIPDDLKLASLFELQLEGPPRPEESLFQIGCVFYQTLTGSVPFEAADLPQPSRPAPPLRSRAPEVPEMVADIVEQMIDPDPSKRPRKAGYVAKALRVFLGTEQGAREERAEENVAAPVSPTEEAREETVEAAVVPTSRPQPTEESEEESSTRLNELWREIRPRERDLVFLGIGAVALIVVVLLVQLIVGWKFINTICLIAGGVIAFFVDRFLRWREQQQEQEA
jgi:serine/threonine protein kinase